MAAKLYSVVNGPAPTTAAPAKVATGTSIKTLIQIATPSTIGLRVVEWGISFDGISSSAVPIQCELVQTDVAATVTAYAAGDVTKWGDPNCAATLMTLGTTSSGYTSTSEGSTTATRPLDTQLVSPTAGYVKQFPLGREPEVPVSKFLRIRVTAAATVNATAYLIWEE